MAIATTFGTASTGTRNNTKIAEEATEQCLNVKNEIFSLQRVEQEIEQLASRTKKLADACLAICQYLTKKAPKDYKSFSQEQKELLSSLINCMHSLSAIINVQTS
ncbi:MAG: hypothetical protein F6K41_15350 [Symploca sp. SIO3E6]|nr:hypothetical protein [Caldora sp. SIO3E6]